MCRTPCCVLVFLSICGADLTRPVAAQPPATSKQSTPKNSKQKQPPPFRWVNPLKVEIPGVQHATFRSKSMGVNVGYCIYLPPAYSREPLRRFPVVYYLHGGRPGSELKSVKLTAHIDKHIRANAVAPMIYVFVNGGPVSHYNLPERHHAMGEDVFVQELIPHIDATYRTIAAREGRALEGFSQGGRGTARIMFKHPGLFCSAAPGGGGFATEKRISEENGKESESLVFAPGYNAWDLARAYAQSDSPRVNILVHVGTKGFNYENNLDYMKFLESLGIAFERLIVPEAPHSATVIYEKSGLELMKFHAANFAAGPQKAAGK
ncbi:MAG: 1,4-beta-xylanase [Planctomycetales bacterium]|nr:1,4-beta-xylanase [Planctomycetales bacterium]